ncbi:MAG TPA: helix-turn-helix domain-containing protein [Burkholderiales bacterium]|nr:helix-turn-helix domain-containing protein [Burkholderiales bacterium]
MKRKKAGKAGTAADPFDKTKRDAAEFLGVTVSTIDRYVRKRKVPHIKLNNHLVRFRISDLVKFAEKQRVA